MTAQRKLLLALGLSACISSTTASNRCSGAMGELAPSGKLRVAINYGNPVLASRNPQTGELQGVAVGVSRQLGRELGAAVELVGYDTVAKLVAASEVSTWDVAFLAVAPARAGELAFTAPYMEVEVTYLVPQQSELRTAPDVDRAGVRIALQEKNAADLFLSKNLKRASLVRTLDEMGAFELLKAGAAEAFASNKQRLLSVVKSNPGYRVLEGRFATIQHAVAVPIGRRAAAACLRDFIEDLKASGFVRRALEEAGAHGVVVAPPAGDAASDSGPRQRLAHREPPKQQTQPLIEEGP